MVKYCSSDQARSTTTGFIVCCHLFIHQYNVTTSCAHYYQEISLNQNEYVIHLVIYYQSKEYVFLASGRTLYLLTYGSEIQSPSFKIEPALAQMIQLILRS